MESTTMEFDQDILLELNLSLNELFVMDAIQLFMSVDKEVEVDGKTYHYILYSELRKENPYIKNRGTLHVILRRLESKGFIERTVLKEFDGKRGMFGFIRFTGKYYR